MISVLESKIELLLDSNKMLKLNYDSKCMEVSNLRKENSVLNDKYSQIESELYQCKIKLKEAELNLQLRPTVLY